jgi:hypothetical protein
MVLNRSDRPRLFQWSSRRAALRDTDEVPSCTTKQAALDSDALTRVGQFIDSLPPASSAVRRVVIGLLIVVVAQVVAGLLGQFDALYPAAVVPSGTERTQLLAALSDAGSLNVVTL